MSNPLLSRVKLPGRIFQLPSKGLFYKEGTFAEGVKDAEIHIQPMSALAEMKMRSPDMIFTGRILKELCEECIPDIKDPSVLVTHDIDAIFTFLRLVTYGAKHKVHSIHNCKNAQLHEHEINIEPMLMNPRNEVLSKRAALYMLPLSNGQVVHLNPPTYQASLEVLHIRQEVAKLESNDQNVPAELNENITVQDLLSVITSVEDVVDGQKINVDDRELIKEWVRTLTRPQVREIVAAANNANSSWGFDFSTELTCKDCKQKYTHAIELDPINFFFG